MCCVFQHQHEREEGVSSGCGGHGGLWQVLAHLSLSGGDEETEGTRQSQGNLRVKLSRNNHHDYTMLQIIIATKYEAP